MDRQEELDDRARRDRDDLQAALERVPPGRSEEMVQRALDGLDLSHFATRRDLLERARAVDAAARG